MLTLPEEVTCDIVSRINDPRDIQRLRRTNQMFRRLASDCIRVLEYPSDTLDDTVPIELVLSLPRLEIIKPFVRLNQTRDLFDLAQLPYLRQVSIDVNNLMNPKYSPLMEYSCTDLSSILRLIFLDAYANQRDPQTLQLTKRSFVGARVLLRNEYSIDLILGGADGHSVALLNGDDPLGVEFNDPALLSIIQERFFDPSHLILGIPISRDSGFIDWLAPTETWELTETVYHHRLNDLLPDIAYLNNENALKSVRLLMSRGDPDEDHFDHGYKFNPSRINREYFPAENPIALDIPFESSSRLINAVLEFFPKVTLIGLYYVYDLSHPEADLLTILQDLTSRSISVKVYTQHVLGDYTNPLVTFVPPLYIDPYDLI